MLKIIKFIFCVLYVALAEELYDVTTVYHVGTNYKNTNEEKSVEVHLRTNARGLPIFCEGKVVDDFIIGRVFPALSDNMKDENNNSIWQTKDWTWKTENQPLFYKGGFTANSIILDQYASKIQPLPRSMTVKLEGFISSDYQLRVFIFSQETELIRSQQEYYSIVFTYNNYKQAALLHCFAKCKSYYMYLRDTDGNGFHDYCNEITHFQMGNWTYDTDNAINSFVLDVSNGGVQLWSDLHQLQKVLDWKPSQEWPPIKSRYFSMYYTSGDGYKLIANFSGHFAADITLGTNASKISPLPSYISVTLEGYIKSNQHFWVLLFSHETELVRSQPDYYSIVFAYNYKQGALMHCSTKYGNNQMYFRDTDGIVYNNYCKEITHFYMDTWTYDTENAYNRFMLNVSNGELQLWSDFYEHKKVVLAWKPTQEYPPVIPRYFSMYYRGGQLKANFSNHAVSVLESHSSNSSPLISPWFTADLDHLCLAVVAKGFIGFNIKAENAEGNRYNLDFEEVNLYEKSWVVLHLTSPLPEQLKKINIRLVLTPTINDTFSIQRISSCNGQEGDDVALLSLEELEAINPLKTQECIFDVYSNNGYKDSRWCLKNLHQLDSNVTFTFNGGCKNGSTFACLPGFAGDKCETACGRNSFGLDCGGICSIYTEECKGTRLCTPAMGCHCAPGYYGEKCEEQCELGKYGNDCDQTCGQCAEQNNCDIYTGHCATCEPGYFPPYCKDTYPVVKSAPILSTPSIGQAKVTPILNDYSGRGVPTMYQIQYRESKQEINKWIIQDTFYNLSDIVSTTLHGLNHGKFYEVRVILFNDNSNNYQGEDVPTTKFRSLCTIPDSMDYYITSTVNTTSMTISWDYKNTSEYWCPIQHYQVCRKEKWNWITENTTDTSFTLTDLISGRIIKFKVRAFTSLGAAPYSKPVRVSTVVKVSGPIQSLSFQHKGNFELITWDPPRQITSEKIDYLIKYQCLRRMACALGCDPSDHLEIQTSSTNVTLNSLMPFTQYLVTVSAGKGPGTSLVIGTKMSVPTETVKASKLSPVRTNNSVTVFWEPVEVCSGFFKGYIYQFYKADDTQIVKTGFTKENHVTIDGLSAKTDYVARIYIENFVGWGADKYLLTNISTSATVPEKVENLTVYKRGRYLLGLRWEQPRKIHGVLKSFTIHYGYRSINNTIVVPPTPCIVWPDLYCHVLDNLSPNQKYTVTVAAKNAEVGEDGVPSSVIEVTKEGTAGLPESVEVLNTTSSSFALAWKYPSMANGIIRSFLLSVEETERFESDKCCQIYPLVETIVQKELVNYSVEVAGLHPASTYTVSLSAKTVTFGLSKALIIYTRPPSMPLQYLPEINMLTQQAWTWLPQNLVETLNKSEIFQPLIKGSILLVVLDSKNPDLQSGIEHEQLLAELKKLIKTDFYFVSENKKGVPTITTEDNVPSVWGTTNIPQLNVGEIYRYAAVQISEYCSVYNIDVVFSSTFTAV